MKKSKSNALFSIVFILGVASHVHASTPNLVEVPDYQDHSSEVESVPDGDSKSRFKYQYKPANDEKPILHKEHREEDVSGGTRYDDGSELVVEPESDALDVSPEPIIEQEDGGLSPATSTQGGSDRSQDEKAK